MPLLPKEVLITAENWGDFINPVVDGKRMRHGLRPRNWHARPHGSVPGVPAFNLPIVPKTEWQARLDLQVSAHAQMSDIRDRGAVDANGKAVPIPSRDQDGKGYCLPPESLVVMADGSRKRIEDVRVGDMVLGLGLVPRRVYQTSTRLFTGQMMRMEVDAGDEPLLATENHEIPYLEMRGWFLNQAARGCAGEKRMYALRDGAMTAGSFGRVGSKEVKEARVHDIAVEGEPYFFVGNNIPVMVHNCWNHSGVSAHLMRRAIMGEPYADLSAYAGACIIKDYRDEGGNGIDGVEFQAKRGCPTSKFWPQQSMDPANDKPETWADAAKHKYLQWVDLDPANMEEQFVTCLLMGFPVVTDYDWWSHSVCGVDIVELGKTGRIWNSWSDQWSANGMGSLSWEKFIPDAAVACIGVMASPA